MDFAVIFDMDGVIVDSNPYHKQAWKRFCERQGLHLSDEELTQKVFGRTGEDALPHLLKRPLNREELRRWSEEVNADYRMLFAPHIRPLPGLKAFLEALRLAGVPVAIATSAPPVNVEFVLGHTGLRDMFPIVIDDTQFTRGKPHPEVYQVAALRLGMDCRRCVVFEDSLSGIEAALDAGMKVVGVTTTHDPSELKHAHLTIGSFQDVSVEALSRLMGGP